MQALESIRDLSKHRYSSRLHFGHIWFMHFGVPMRSQDFTTHFLNEALSQNMAHIDDLPLLGDAQVVLGISSSCVVCRPSYFTRTILISSSFLFFFNEFRKESYVGMWGHYGSRIVGVVLRPLSKVSGSTTNIL